MQTQMNGTAIVHRRAFMAASAATVLAPNFARAQAPVSSDLGWATMTRADRDAAYNNNAAVSDREQISERWRTASARIRARRPQHIDLPYGRGERNKWDLFPGDNPNAPCLVYIHGGYWQAGNREINSGFAEGVLARGWSAALPGYTLAPDATMRQIVQDVRDALGWLAARGSAHGILGPLILSGGSAGAHLTAMTLDHPSVRAGLAISVRDAFKRHRCIIPASGYYEWIARPDGKHPYFMSAADGGVLSFAGLWDRDQANARRISCVVKHAATAAPFGRQFRGR